MPMESEQGGSSIFGWHYSCLTATIDPVHSIEVSGSRRRGRTPAAWWQHNADGDAGGVALMKVMEVSLVGGTGYTKCARETNQGFRNVGGGRITARGTTTGDRPPQIVSDGYIS
jgi:hypothetical protein